VLLLWVAGCAPPAGGGGEALVGRTFVSESLVRDGAPAKLVEGTRILVEFSDDGWVLADAGCNHMGAEVSVIGGRLITDGASTTLMGCDPLRAAQDQWIMDLLAGSSRWAPDSNRLTLTGGTTRLVLLDRRFADPGQPVEGVRWVVDDAIRAGSSEAIPPWTVGSAWLEIEGGRFTASSGCRDIEGAVTVTGGRMLFGDTVQTDPDCLVARLRVDAVFATVLTGEIEFYFQGDQLILEHPDGVGLSLRAGG
jgi:heat shock protein HslJ